MGVYIKGMEMPKRGHTITITIVGSGQAYVEYFDCRHHAEETIEYAAVPVPPHGRLIDAEKIYDAVEQRYRISSGIEHRCERDLLDLICAAPTIIEAEEGET